MWNSLSSAASTLTNALKSGDGENGVETDERNYKGMLVDFQMEQLKLSREYQSLMSEKERQIADLQSEVQKLRASVDVDMKASMDEKESHTSSEKPSGDLEKQLRAADDTIKGLRDTADGRERQLREAIQEKTRIQATVADRDKTIVELEEQNSAQAETLECLARDKQRLIECHASDAQTIDGLVEEYTKLSAESAEQHEKDEERVKVLQNQCDELATKLRAYEQNLLHLMDKSSDESTEEGRVLKALSQATKKCETLELELASKDEQILRLLSSINEKDELGDPLGDLLVETQKRVITIEGDLRSMVDSLKESEEERQLLNHKLEEVKKVADVKSKFGDEMSQKVEALESEAARIEAENKELRTKVSEPKAVVNEDETKKALAAKEEELAQTKSALEKAEHAVEQNERMKKLLKALRDVLKDKDKALEESRAAQDKLRGELEKLKIVAMDKDKALEEGRTSQDELRNELEKLKEVAKGKEKALEEGRTAQDELRGELERIKEVVKVPTAAESDATIQHLTKELEEAKAKNTELQANLESTQELVEVHEYLCNTEKQKEECAKTLQEALAQVEGENKELKSKVEETGKSLQEAQELLQSQAQEAEAKLAAAVASALQKKDGGNNSAAERTVSDDDCLREKTKQLESMQNNLQRLEAEKDELAAAVLEKEKSLQEAQELLQSQAQEADAKLAAAVASAVQRKDKSDTLVTGPTTSDDDCLREKTNQLESMQKELLKMESEKDKLAADVLMKEKALADASASYQTQLQETEAKLAAAMATTEREKEEEQKNLRELEQKESLAKHHAEELAKQLDVVRRELETKLKQELEKAKSSEEEALKKLQEALESSKVAAVSEIEEQKNKEIKELQDQVASLQKVDACLELKREKEDALDSLRKELQIEHLKEIQTLTTDFEAEKKSALERVEIEKDSVMEALKKGIEIEHEKELECQKAKLEAAMKQALEDAERLKLEALADVEKQKERQVGNAKAAMAEQLAKEIEKQKEMDKKEKEAALNALNKEKEGELAEALAKVSGKFEQEKHAALDALRISLQQQVEAAEKASAEALQRLEENLEAKIQQAVVERENYKGLYSTESRKRRLIQNRLLEAQGNIRVFCRVRPIIDVERTSGGAKNVAGFPGEDKVIIHKDELTEHTFEFDGVFGPACDQEQVFESILPMISSLMDGYNVCIFAYGQTGTGKTYTMEGPPGNPGVNIRFLHGIFDEQHAREDMSYSVKISVIEIYNETIRDLLLDSADCPNGSEQPKLEIKQGKAGPFVPGVTKETVTDIDDILQLMEKARANRAVGSHDMNEHSSRSHAVLTVSLEGENLQNGKGVFSRLHLIDLAGSERISKTDATGDRLKEAQSINTSLSALGDVINALASKNAHIPYRNSKLTHLLQDSLGGNSKVMMFVNISPAEYNVTESLCSLNFAARCRSVKLGKAEKNTESEQILKYRKMIKRLQEELQKCKPLEEMKSP